MVYILVGTGGIAGTLLRYYFGLAAEDLAGGSFPFGTFAANMAGSFFLGWITASLSGSKRLLKALGTGLIGSFTTFSAFSVETVHLLYAGHPAVAFCYVLFSMFGGLLLSWAGYQGGHRLFRKKEKGVETA